MTKRLSQYFSLTAFVLLFLLQGCCTRVVQDDSSKQELMKVHSNVQKLALQMSIPRTQVDKESTKDLLVDINSLLLDSVSYPGRSLTDDELKVISSYLYNQPQILKIIKEHNSYIQRIRGKRILVLPREGE